MKSKLRKIFMHIIVIITIFNLYTSLFATSANQVYATSSTRVIQSIDEEADDDSPLDGALDYLGTGVDIFNRNSFKSYSNTNIVDCNGSTRINSWYC